MNQIDFDLIKSSVRISEVLTKYGIPTKNRDVYRIPCPFHGTTGSGDNFTVDERKGVYHCFVCNQGGSVIDLVMHLENCDLKTAVEKLAGNDLTRFQSNPVLREYRQAQTKMETWIDLQKRPPSINEEIPDTIPLESGYRSLSDEAIQTFGLRRIPGDGWGTGIFIPFREQDGSVVGYAIRHPDGLLREDGKKAPKYINTKGDIKNRGFLYGLYEAQEAIKASSTAILVEGQFDAISMWDHGFRNVVCVMGSYLTPGQALRIVPLATKLVILFDGDDAGREGAERVRARWKNTFDISVYRLPDGSDPASFDFRQGKKK